MPHPYSGGCQCGAVRYTLNAEPLAVIACHCTECQRQSGSAFGMSMRINLADLTLTGSVSTYTRTADSGNSNIGTFCPTCGNRIYNENASLPGFAVLKPGTLDDPSWVRPQAFIWMKSAQGWVPVPEDTPCHDGQFP